MERTPAACAMEWSIELEKGVRSKLPGRPLEAISQSGSRLQLWSQDPEPTLAAYRIFDLIPGEDRLFANATLLRLAEAFRVGDEKTRVCVVKVFLSEYKPCCKQKGKGYKGLLSKSRVHNQLELLNRVKAAFDNGDVNSRALALALFGCWAEFANDKADIRYLVLSSLVSPHVLETGLQLFLDTSEEDFQVAMLVSLSKLASMSMMLISEQVVFLFSFLNQEKSLRARATALRCLLFIISKRVCQFPVNAYMVKALSIMLDEPELLLTMQCEALSKLEFVELLILSKQGHSLATWLESKISPLANGSEGNINKPDFRKEFEVVYTSICSSQETLEVASTSSQEFCFQRWFLSLRAKLLQALTDVLKALGTTLFVRECIGNNGYHDKSLMVEFWVSLQQITQISLQLNNPAKEFDLITTSFCDMD